jgi:diguanylate cyclase (GGDEF)-like protein/PAS domain S-box-containing protein
VVAGLQIANRNASSMALDAHLIQLSRTYHLDNHVMALLVDRSAEVAHQQDHHFFSVFLDGTTDFVYASDLQGRMVLANNAMLQFLGRSRDEVVGHPREYFLPLRDAILHQDSDQRILNGGEPVNMEERIHSVRSSAALELLTRKFPLHDSTGKVTGVGGISTDITELKDQQRQALLSESVFVTATESILVTDPHTRIIRVNPAFTRLTGFSEASVVGHRASILKSGRQDPAFYAAMWRSLIDTGQWAGEISNRAADGSVYTVWTSINSISDARGQLIYYVAVQTNLTPMLEAQSKIEQLASYDSLTGLPNRSLFNDRLNQLLANSHRHGLAFALIFLDLDHFKEVNDSLGHQIGDELLQGIARRLQKSVRSEDTVARMGGDEFVVLLPLSDRTRAQMVTDKLLESLRHPMPLGAMDQYQPMASAGIAVFPEDGATGDMLLRNADTAMYEAKTGGRNRSAAYTIGMRELNDRVFSIQTELAVGIDRQELRLFYQPKFNLKTGKLAGAEALVRWERPMHGLVGPADFIPIAEKSGLIVAIDKWVLDEALRKLGEWKQSGLWDPSWRMAVNQSVSDMRRPTMLIELTLALRLHDVPAAALEMEITEGALMDHTEDMIRRLTELRALGVSLAIDDFGTGFSSLAYLRKLPISVIKIDQGFVRDMLVNENDRVLVETIVAMALNLGHSVVAEGVEELAQQERLTALGCEAAQGYLFGRPVAADVFAATYLAPL